MKKELPSQPKPEKETAVAEEANKEQTGEVGTDLVQQTGQQPLVTQSKEEEQQIDSLKTEIDAISLRDTQVPQPKKPFEFPLLPNPKSLTERFRRSFETIKLKRHGIVNPQAVLQFEQFLKKCYPDLDFAKAERRLIDKIVGSPDIVSVLDLIFQRTDLDKAYGIYDHLDFLSQVAENNLSQPFRQLIETGVSYSQVGDFGFYDTEQKRMMTFLQAIQSNPEFSQWINSDQFKELVKLCQPISPLAFLGSTAIESLFQIRLNPNLTEFLKQSAGLGYIPLAELANNEEILNHPNLFPLFKKMRQTGYGFDKYKTLPEFSQALLSYKPEDKIYSDEAKGFVQKLKEIRYSVSIGEAATVTYLYEHADRLVHLLRTLEIYNIHLSNYDLAQQDKIREYLSGATLTILEKQENQNLAKALPDLSIEPLKDYQLGYFLKLCTDSNVRQALESQAGQAFIKASGKKEISIKDIFTLPELLQIPSAEQVVAGLAKTELWFSFDEVETIATIAQDPQLLAVLNSPQLPSLVARCKDAYRKSNKVYPSPEAKGLKALAGMIANPKLERLFFASASQSKIEKLRNSYGLQGLRMLFPMLSYYEQLEKLNGQIKAQFGNELKVTTWDDARAENEFQNLQYLLDNQGCLNRITEIKQRLGASFSLENLETVVNLSEDDLTFLQQLRSEYNTQVTHNNIPVLISQLPREQLLAWVEFLKKHNSRLPEKTDDLKLLLTLGDKAPARLTEIEEILGIRSYITSYLSDYEIQNYLRPIAQFSATDIEKFQTTVAFLKSRNEQLSLGLSDLPHLVALDVSLLKTFFELGYFPSREDLPFIVKMQGDRQEEIVSYLQKITKTSAMTRSLNSDLVRGTSFVFEQGLQTQLAQAQKLWEQADINPEVLEVTLVAAIGRSGNIDSLRRCLNPKLAEVFKIPSLAKVCDALYAAIVSAQTDAGVDNILSFLLQPAVQTQLNEWSKKVPTFFTRDLFEELISGNRETALQVLSDENFQSACTIVPRENLGFILRAVWHQPEKAKQLTAILQDQSVQEVLKQEDAVATACLDFIVSSVNRLSPEQLAVIVNLVKSARDLITQPRLHNFVLLNIDRFAHIPTEKLRAYIEVILKIEHSPSQEIQRLHDQLLGEIVNTDNPVASYEKIESVFIENNLPTVGKAFKVFEILHPPEVFAQKLGRGRCSPVLTQAKYRRRLDIVYRDLLRVHTDSANYSLREYVSTLLDGQAALQAAEEKGFDRLNQSEQEKLHYCFDKLETLFVNSLHGRRLKEPVHSNEEDSLPERYEALRVNLSCRPNQTITARISEMFLRPVGLSDLNQVSARMIERKKIAHQRGLTLYDNAERVTNENGQEERCLRLETGDLTKGVTPDYIENILQNGSVAKEYLGAASGSDATPFDTDVSQVLETDLVGETVAAKNLSALNFSMAPSYGSLIFVVKDRGQFQRTSQEEKVVYDPDKLELFETGGGRHFGIRAGFAATEIDFIIAQDDFLQRSYRLENLFYEIAQNGYYIPIANKEGKIIFTPELYGQYRKTFQGLERYDGEPLEFKSTSETDLTYPLFQRIANEIAVNRENVAQLQAKVRRIITGVLNELGVELKSVFNSSILGAELLDTGSTGRSTNVPGSVDFDLILRLDDDDFSKVDTIIAQLRRVLRPVNDQSHWTRERRYFQLRAGQSTGIVEGAQIDVDLGITVKSEPKIFGSHNAVEEKLDWIKRYISEEAYQQTVINIILTKLVLNQGKAYKPIEHGGFGGIGVENWILANGGNMLEAFRTFKEAAYEDEQKISFERFKRKYKLLNAGVNIRHNNHDNYIEKLEPRGYEAMLDIINNVEKLLQEVKLGVVL